MKSLIHIFIIALLFVGVTGCGLKNSDENSHPMFQQGLKAQQSNEFSQAIKYFNRYLSLKPDSSKAHLRLAAIYDENLDKPLRAVYHYERFLELSPNSSESTNVKKWQEAALKKFYITTRDKYNDPEDVSKLQNELFRTQQQLKKYKFELKKTKSIQKKLIQYARQKRDDEKVLKAKLSKLQATHQKTLNELKEKTVPKDEEKKEEKKEIIKATVKPEPKPKEKVKVSSVIPKAAVAPEFVLKKANKEDLKSNSPIRTYTVKRGDSLSSISRQLYGSAKFYKLISEANRETIASDKDLRPGQVLKIPQL